MTSLISKIIIFAISLFAVTAPKATNIILNNINNLILENFKSYYILLIAFLLICALFLAILPKSKNRHLGCPKTKPHFSTISWFSMMFSAGIGIGLLTYASAEPIYHFGNNPDIILNQAAPYQQNAINSAFKWSFFHWGFSAWACYSICGLIIAHFSYNHQRQLNFSYCAKKLFTNQKLANIFAQFANVTCIIATIFGIAVTIGFGVTQLTFGTHHLSKLAFLVKDDQSNIIALLLILITVMSASFFSAASGVDKGIKILSNLNIVISLILLSFFFLAGPTLAIANNFIINFGNYLINLPKMSIQIWQQNQQLDNWQNNWSIFYFAWWISFTPFVGIFLARISKHRSIREYLLVTIIAPSIMCFLWLSIIGHSAIDLELSGQAQGAIINANLSNQLFITLKLLTDAKSFLIISTLIIISLIIYLVTSADSAILIINNILEKEEKNRSQIATWTILITILIASLLISGGLAAIKSAMIISALPFSFILLILTIALIKDLLHHPLRAKLKN